MAEARSGGLGKRWARLRAAGRRVPTMGDRFTDEEVDEMYREAPIDKKGNFNYVEFTRILKHGAKDKDD